MLGPMMNSPLRRWRDVQVWAHSTFQLGQLQVTRDPETTVHKLLDGHAVICFPRGYVTANVQGLQRRTPEEPSAEMSIRGPRDGFTESLDTNVSQIRSRLRDRKLMVRTFEFGTRTRTKVILLYLEDLANPNIVEEAVRRLQRVQVDGLLDSGALEQWIEDNPWSPYPQLQSTERPDKTIA
ncbi:MAG: spore germination protein, partial [Alicyclobacillus sp.]|nr:spore germination protein [Alicyclobacillus sp.]